MTLAQFFSERKRWTKGTLSRLGTHRMDIDLSDCFCLVGAMCYLFNNKRNGDKGLSKEYIIVLNKLRASMLKITEYIDLVQLNDLGGYKKVMEVINHAGV